MAMLGAAAGAVAVFVSPARFPLRAGVAWAAAHPVAWLRLAGAKVGWLLGLEGREHAWVYSVGYFDERRPLTVTLWGVLLMASLPLLVGGAASGLVRARRETTAPSGMQARARRGGGTNVDLSTRCSRNGPAPNGTAVAPVSWQFGPGTRDACRPCAGRDVARNQWVAVSATLVL
ncbi:MAG: hypothetical protein JNL48_12155 [Acidobacteria bacterium]|nr:hypothetical protein [Acidobacteriota bacterium]